ncbi:MAG: SH3 domain-containing protein [Acidimicrobiia bacterium]|nr:SH3 domain-containing protein [Acidimicrobiia bacterium]MYB08934.1 SH3 domain-containing protein [Acidimicrobiia bacterium]MYG57347.1 SH3 domain-containing protein [Acidimicrobiia bacterium]MYG71022.1 SH3 domain-containing protein [Acidimicrobiia bacterium]MYH97407.1 SH3 domain-containing protein [Acidimicrobiia bacterium]
MGVRAIVFCVAVAGLAFVALSLAGIVSTWGLDWVTIESEETESESTPEPTPTEAPLPEPVEVVVELEIDPRYPPETRWTVFDVPSALNVRAGPSTAHQVLGTANLGSTVTLTGQVVESPTSGTWVQVRANTVTGWVFAAYLTPEA